MSDEIVYEKKLFKHMVYVTEEMETYLTKLNLAEFVRTGDGVSMSTIIRRIILRDMKNSVQETQGPHDKQLEHES